MRDKIEAIFEKNIEALQVGETGLFFYLISLSQYMSMV